MLRYIQVDETTGRLLGVAGEGFHLGSNEQLIELPEDFVIIDFDNWVLKDGTLQYEPLPKSEPTEPTEPAVPLEQQIAELQTANEATNTRLTEVENSFAALLGGIASAYSN